MWDLPGPGIEPVSPALAGRFLATVPPGKSGTHLFEANHSTYLHVCLGNRKEANRAGAEGWRGREVGDAVGKEPG